MLVNDSNCPSITDIQVPSEFLVEPSGDISHSSTPALAHRAEELLTIIELVFYVVIDN